MAMTIGNNGAPGTATLPAAPVLQGGAPQPAAKVSVAVPEPAPQQQPQPEQVQKAVESLKQLVEAKAPNSLAFSIDDSTGKTIVRITDAETGDMIRQIPSEEMLEIARSLDRMQGMLLQEKG
ncbi:MAG: flagellar protein FlaG [Pseudomonadota bacterium]